MCKKNSQTGISRGYISGYQSKLNTSPHVDKIHISSIQNILAYEYIPLTGTKVISASVQNVLACKYIAPMGEKIVSVVVQIILTGKNLPHRLQLREYLCHCMVMKLGDKSPQIYITKTWFKLTFHFQGLFVINPICS